MVDASLVVSLLAAALGALCLWTLTGLRKSVHDLRNELQPLMAKVAVLEARDDWKRELRDMLVPRAA